MKVYCGCASEDLINLVQSIKTICSKDKRILVVKSVIMQARQNR